MNDDVIVLLALLTLFLVFTAIGAHDYHWRTKPPALPEPDWADAADEVGFFDPIDHLLVNVSAWTPAEREALGVNATDILIDAIDKELKGAEWQRLTAGRYLPAPPVRTYETASEKAIRRNGAQITAGVIDATTVWVGPAMNGGAR